MKLTKAQRAKARTAQQKAAIACVLHGHPPIVRSCIGQVTCGRCDEILGDTIMGGMNLKGRAIVGHEGTVDAPCHECRKAVKALKPCDLVHLPKDVRAWVKKVRAA